jgi:hypothetical protein
MVIDPFRLASIQKSFFHAFQIFKHQLLNCITISHHFSAHFCEKALLLRLNLPAQIILYLKSNVYDNNNSNILSEKKLLVQPFLSQQQWNRMRKFRVNPI